MFFLQVGGDAPQNERKGGLEQPFICLADYYNTVRV